MILPIGADRPSRVEAKREHSRTVLGGSVEFPRADVHSKNRKAPIARISPATRDSVFTSQPAMFDAMMQALGSISRYGCGLYNNSRPVRPKNLERVRYSGALT
jgi:hypothetical protein